MEGVSAVPVVAASSNTMIVLALTDAVDRLLLVKRSIMIPSSLRTAGHEIRTALAQPLKQMPTPAFVRAWSSVAYLFPGLHPDGWEAEDSGWPRVLRRFAAEAWRRAETGELADEELYPSDSQWCGLYDRMAEHTPEESARRMVLAAAFGDSANV